MKTFPVAVLAYSFSSGVLAQEAAWASMRSGVDILHFKDPKLEDSIYGAWVSSTDIHFQCVI